MQGFDNNFDTMQILLTWETSGIELKMEEIEMKIMFNVSKPTHSTNDVS